MSSTEYRESEPFTQVAIGPLAAWRRHWVRGVVSALVGAVVGVAAGFAIPAAYTAEARVAVGAGDLTSGAVAGFPIAASGLASNYARYVNDRGIAKTDVPEGVELSASQIPESNVIRIEAVSADPDAATAAANTAANQLVTIVNSGNRQSADEVFNEFAKAAKADAKAQTKLAAEQYDLGQLLIKEASKSKIRAARDDVSAAMSAAASTAAKAAALKQQYSYLIDGTRTAASLMVIRTADGLSSSRTSRVSQLGLLGLIVGAAVGLVIAARLERQRPSSSSVVDEKATGPDGA